MGRSERTVDAKANRRPPAAHTNLPNQPSLLYSNEAYLLVRTCDFPSMGGESPLSVRTSLRSLRVLKLVVPRAFPRLGGQAAGRAREQRSGQAAGPVRRRAPRWGWAALAATVGTKPVMYGMWGSNLCTLGSKQKHHSSLISLTSWALEVETHCSSSRLTHIARARPASRRSRVSRRKAYSRKRASQACQLTRCLSGDVNSLFVRATLVTMQAQP